MLLPVVCPAVLAHRSCPRGLVRTGGRYSATAALVAVGLPQLIHGDPYAPEPGVTAFHG